MFSALMDPVIEGYHRGYKLSTGHGRDLNPAHLGAAAENPDPTGEFISSTRIRVARNLRGFPLPCKVNVEQRREIERRAVEALNSLDGELAGQYYSLTTDQAKKRYVFRKCFIIPAIAAGSPPYTVAHGIANVQQYTDYYGVCLTDVPDSRSLPYPSVTANANIEFKVDDTNITIINGAASPNIVSGSVTLEYLKQ